MGANLFLKVESIWPINTVYPADRPVTTVELVNAIRFAVSDNNVRYHIQHTVDYTLFSLQTTLMYRLHCCLDDPSCWFSMSASLFQLIFFYSFSTFMFSPVFH